MLAKGKKGKRNLKNREQEKRINKEILIDQNLNFHLQDLYNHLTRLKFLSNLFKMLQRKLRKLIKKNLLLIINCKFQIKMQQKCLFNHNHQKKNHFYYLIC